MGRAASNYVSSYASECPPTMRSMTTAPGRRTGRISCAAGEAITIDHHAASSHRGAARVTLASNQVSNYSAGIQEHEHREHPTVVIVGCGQLELGQNASDMLFDGTLADKQPIGDSAVRAALGH